MKKRNTLPASQIGIVGAGVMGAALGRAMLDTGLAKAAGIWATTRTGASASVVEKELGIRCTVHPPTQWLQKTKILFLCVKPGQARGVLKSLLKAGLRADAVVVSIVTGLTLADIQSALGRAQPTIRIITNTPLLVREACTAITSTGNIPAEQGRFVQGLFAHLGLVQEVEESLCDVLTGLSASGPAYMYLIMEAFADGGVRMGLARETALQFTAQMVRGAATMVQRSGRHPASLRDDVTTPSGCTIAGLFVMEDGKLRSTLARAVEEATKTARALGQSTPPK